MNTGKPYYYKWFVSSENYDLVINYDDLIGMTHQLYAISKGWANTVSAFSDQEECLMYGITFNTT